MKKRVLSFCVAALAAPLIAGTYYVSPSGSAEAAGTEDDPYDLATGVHKAYSYSFDELRFLPGTYKCGAMNRDEWRIIGGGTLYVGWGATRDDVVLDFEGAGTKLTVENGMVANLTVSNFVMNAGAVGLNGGGVISNCVIKCGNGLGLDVSSLKALAVDCEIRNVTGGLYGCAVGNGSASAKGTLLRCVIADNTYTSSVGGSGAYLTGGEVNSCIFSNNVSEHVGCIDAQMAAGEGLFVTNTTFVDNLAKSNGGGAIYLNSQPDTESMIVDCHFIRNSALNNSAGGCLNLRGSGRIRVIDCDFTGLSEGGAVGTDGTPQVEIVKCTFDGQKSGGGPGLRLMATGAACVISNCTFRNYVRNDYGGAIKAEGPNSNDGMIRFAVLDSVFEDNVSTNGGGAIATDYAAWSRFGSRGVCTNCVFRRNVANQGGALYMAAGDFVNCTFEDCVATNLAGAASQPNSNGGAYWPGYRGTVNHPDATNYILFANCSFLDCLSSGQKASAVHAEKRDLTVTDCTFRGCRTGTAQFGWSGALSVDNTTPHLTVDRCRFEACFSPGQGAALAMNTSTDANQPVSTIRNSLFLANSNTYYWAGAAVVASHTRVENCAFIGNRCDQTPNPPFKGQCAGLQLRGTAADSAVVNCLFYDNRDSSWSVSQVNDVYPATGRDTCVSYSASNYGFFKEELHNLNGVDPKFADAAKGDYRLQKGSPCINRGLNDLAWMTGARDLQNSRKVNRIMEDVVDIGCYEYRPTPGLLLWVR